MGEKLDLFLSLPDECQYLRMVLLALVENLNQYVFYMLDIF